MVTDPAAGRRALADPRGRRGAGRPHQRRAAPRTPAGRTPPSRPTQLGAYLRELRGRCSPQHRLHGVPYGHFGDGCVHVRIDFPFGRRRTAGRRRPRGLPLLRRGRRARWWPATAGRCRASTATAGPAASCSPPMYSADALALFERVKGLFDPDDVLNPGVLVRPAPLDADVRVAAARAATGTGLALAYAHDGGDFSAAVHRCTGVGKCRADLSATGGVMCPSYPATREEKDSTRGRARVLQEMLAPGGPVQRLALARRCTRRSTCACRARAAPATARPGVDMATYKAEVLHQTYRRRLRPAVALRAGPAAALGRPRRAGAAAGQRRDRLAARRAARPLVGRAWTSAATCRRSHRRTFRQLWAARPAAGRRRRRRWRCGSTRSPTTSRPRWRIAAVRVLEAAGYRVQVAGRRHLLRADLDHHRPARRRAERILRPHGRAPWRPLVDAGRPDRRAGAVLHGRAARRRDRAARRPGRGPGRGAAPAPWPSCWPATPGLDAAVAWTGGGRRPAALPPRRRAGLVRRRGAAAPTPARRVTRLGGCCGLAGNWGVERGHHDVSVAIAEPAAAARGDGPARRRRRPGRRLLLPHPARPAGRAGGACTSPSCWPARPGDRPGPAVSSGPTGPRARPSPCARRP